MSTHHYSSGDTGGGQRGLSLIELMVALVISAVLVLGAGQVYVGSRNSYNQNETVSRLQETARYALSVIETDVRMANYWGLMQNSPPISGAPIGQALPLAAVANAVAANVCGQNFATDVTTFLQADNNLYQLSLNNTRTAACDSLSGWNTLPVGTADTLTVRHASVLPASGPLPNGGAVGTLQLCSTQSNAALISNGVCPLPVVPPVVQQINNVIVDAYYVDQNSAQQNGLPSLHRKALTSVGGAITWQDQEIVAGVEDMQVEFGIDPGTNTGTAQRYVSPNDPILAVATTQVVAVRVWLMVRSDTPETGFIDGITYVYADRAAGNGVTYDLNTAANATMAYRPQLDPAGGLGGRAHCRRLLVSRTIQIRNTYRS
jgi:type IV pilus assembly protein PilW